MKLRVVCRKLYDYVRYDLKEIAFPSSLPDPPHIKKRRKLTWMERWLVLREASRLYAASWVRDIGPDLRPNDYKKKDEESEVGTVVRDAKHEKKEPSTLEDLAVAARGGMETLRPALQRVYMVRASAYRDALKSFIEGYQEGIKQVMEPKESAKPEQEENAGVMYIGTFLIGVGYVAHLAIVPAAASELFGIKNFGALYNFLTVANPTGSLIFSGVIASGIYDYEAERQAHKLQNLSMLGRLLYGTRLYAGEALKCEGSVCFFLSSLIMSGFCIVAVILSMILVYRTKVVYANLYGKSRT